MTDKTPEEVLIDIAREHPDFYEKYVIKGDEMDEELREKAKKIRVGEADPIDTVHSGEYAAMLITERIPFRVDYPREFQSEFHVHPTDIDEAYNLLMQLRGSKLR